MNHGSVNYIISYHSGSLFIHFDEIVLHAVIDILTEKKPVMRMASKEIVASNFISIPLLDVKGKYHIHVRINEEETIKTIVIP